MKMKKTQIFWCKTKQFQKSVCKHKVAFFTLNSPPLTRNVTCSKLERYAYSSSYNLAPAISRVLIGQRLIFCSPTWPTCCNSTLKCTPVKHKARQKAGFQIVTYTTSTENIKVKRNCQCNTLRSLLWNILYKSKLSQIKISTFPWVTFSEKEYLC